MMKKPYTFKNQVGCRSYLLKDDESEVRRVPEELPCPNLPFDELIKQLNGGYYLDTIEFGNIQIEDVPWPTVATDKNKYTNAISAVQQIHHDPKKLDNKICKISEIKEIRSLELKKKPGVCTSNQVGFRSNLLKDDEEVSKIVEELSCPNLPFDELIKQLNGGYYLDTIEFGNIQIEDVPWPTVATEKNKYTNAISAVQHIHHIDPKKLDNKLCMISENKEIRSLELKKKPGVCTSNQVRSYIESSGIKKKFTVPEKKEIRSLGVTKQPGSYNTKNQVWSRRNFLKDDESGVKGVLEKILGSDLPLNHSCSVQDKISSKNRASIVPTIVRKKEGTDNNTILKGVSFSSTVHTKNVSSVVLGCPTNNDDEEKKLESSRIKMRRQYEELESEKKRRRIHVIEHQRPVVADQPQTGKKVKKVPLVKKLLNMRNSQLYSRRTKPLTY